MKANWHSYSLKMFVVVAYVLRERPNNNGIDHDNNNTTELVIACNYSVFSFILAPYSLNIPYPFCHPVFFFFLEMRL